MDRTQLPTCPNCKAKGLIWMSSKNWVRCIFCGKRYHLVLKKKETKEKISESIQRN